MVNRVREIKHAQREALIYKEISHLFVRITYDEKVLSSLYVTRVSLSPDRSNCTIFFQTLGGLADFETKLPTLVLYKPSLRTALSKNLHGRYVPDLVFKYDEQFDKQRHVEDLMDKLKEEGKL
jgi:ribosome-binding factor A